MKYKVLRLTLASTTAFLTIAPALAQEAPASSNDIVVTARRIEERLQDVPISITVFNQQQLANKNVTDATTLATYTPSLSANNDFGSDNTSFAIRGFSQDIGTAPSVGVYFGDVVVPRGGSNGQPIGDNASPGDFFDLQSVQVLKGPQGTLFGRNTTGGAVIFVPQKPVDKLDAYLEGSYGNYDMKRVQGMINIPLNDTFLVRAAFDHMSRDGWLHNISGIGPKRFNDTDYWAGRVSVVANLTPDLENYMIASYTRSVNGGGISKLVAANGSPTSLFGPFAAQQLAQQNATGDFYAVENAQESARLKTESWQIINTTTWRASDSLTVRNIASYAQLQQGGTNGIFGLRFQVPVGGTIYSTDFATSTAPPGGYSANEATITDEFRLAGNGNRFNWQAGAYFEAARPLSSIGSRSPQFTNCGDTDGSTFQCTDVFRGLLAEELGIPAAFLPAIGNINETRQKASFQDVGIYAQGTYKLTDKFKVTGGIRNTWDHERIAITQSLIQLAAAPAFGPTGTTCTQSLLATLPDCRVQFYTHSKAPTWLIDLDYNPSRDVLVYAKYARGYRAATISPNLPVAGTAANPDFSLNYAKPEKVDAYEAGLKSSFGGALRGTFNVAGFYNKFSNQQLQVGFLPQLGAQVAPTAAPVNAGASTIYGAEVEASLRPFKGLELDGGYTYLRTRIDKTLPLPSNALYITTASFRVGDEEVLAPKHKFTLGATYTLPFSKDVGKISFGAAVTYRSSELTNYNDRNNPDPTIAAFGRLPGLTLVDANANWASVGGSSIDLAFFVTNLTGRKYYVFANGLGDPSLNLETATVGEPRMFGGRIRYRFGK